MNDKYEKIPLSERQKRHKELHPNDKGVKKENKGVTWKKATAQDKKLETFYKTHIYTFVDENDISKKTWICIAGSKGEEE